MSLETDVLDYTEEYLQTLSDDELIKLADLCSYYEEQYDIGQKVKKILINSLYGAITKQAFIVYNMFVAGAITSTGRYFIQMLGKYLEDFLQEKLPSNARYWVYTDTDSCYFQINQYVIKFCERHNTEDLMDKIQFCDKFTDQVMQKIVDKCIFDFTDSLNAFEPKHCGCKREIIADTMIWCEKKHYFGRERADESGIFPLTNPEIKVMGLDLVKSTTSSFAKNHIYKLLDVMFDSDEETLRDALADIKDEFYEADIDDIAMVGNCSSLDYDLNDKGVPFGVRATLVYNKFIKEHQLESEYSVLASNEKTKRLYLRLPNRFDSNAIAYLDKKFANKYLKQCIDYDLMFEKSFMSLVKNMTKNMGYNLDRLTVLDEW